MLFRDLVDSTALSARLDPEELRQIVRACQQVCADIIARYEGRIAQYPGDGLLVYFGYPTAHEDDAQRAVRVGLEIVQALHVQVPSPLVEERQGEETKSGAAHTPHPNLPSQGGKEKRLQVRISVHTGLVVVGEIGGGAKREHLALGDTPNIAARLPGLASPNTVVLSGSMQQLVAGLFDCAALGQHAIKGLSTSMQIYQAQGASGAHSRLEIASRRRLTPLIGREHEMQLLLDRWEQAKIGAGQVVLLTGEPGIGKSRLVHRLKEQGTAKGKVKAPSEFFAPLPEEILHAFEERGS